MSVINQVLRDLDARGAGVSSQRHKAEHPGPWHQAQVEHLLTGPTLWPAQTRQPKAGRGDDPWRLPISGVLVGVLGVMLVGGPWLSGLLEMGQRAQTAQTAQMAQLAQMAQVPTPALLTPIDSATAKAPPIALMPKTLTPTAPSAPKASPHRSTSATVHPSLTSPAASLEELPPPAAGPIDATSSRPTHLPRTKSQPHTPADSNINSKTASSPPTGDKLAPAATVASAAVTPVTSHPALTTPLKTSQPASQPTPLPALEQASVEKTLTPLSPEQRAQASYAQAVESAQSGRSMQALTQAQDALQHQPSHHLARHLAAVLLHETARTAQALELLNEGLKLDPQAQALSLLLARLQAHQGALQAALQTLDQHQLHSLEAESLRAGLWSQLRNHQRAAIAYEAALKMQPGQATLWLGLGVALEAQAQRGPAHQAFSRAQAMGLGDPELSAFVAQRLKALE